MKEEEVEEFLDGLAEEWHSKSMKINSHFERGEFDDDNIPFFEKKNRERRLRSEMKRKVLNRINLKLSEIEEEVIEQK